MSEVKQTASVSDKEEPSEHSGKQSDFSEDAVHTERSVERQIEDKDFIPVIVKRNDEAVRHPDDVLEKAINEGLEQLRRPLLSFVLSSVGAGLILGFTVMAVAVMATFTSSAANPLIPRLAMALVYPLGFIICIMSGTQLFTEHTATAVYPVLAKQASVSQLLRLWICVIIGNELGAACSAGLLMLADDVVLARDGYLFIGHHLVGQSAGTLLVSSVLAGWLMAIGAWLVLVSPPGFSQMLCIYIVTFLIGLGGLHHSIAGSVEILTAIYMSEHFTFLDGARFIGLSMVGNLIGGSVFVAGFNFSHIRKTQELKDDLGG
ncbi:formate/nitrite transporter family protein [Desulfogranum japonicum]|uniref:formate/nitrite transporter family protein n=1 Tax=Desulfogranum japonicum TaxID=231447 RepID=UPI0004239588|nr:formate/nitrite transporter family protein [Desulfogranum japonicum]